jgi:ribonuclease Z
MKITFLGTSSMVPTKERNHNALLINYENENILVDCGEGTQRQLRIAKISPTKITKILLTHWHGDHVFGLPGLLQTLGANEYKKTLEIYGPKGTKTYFKKILLMYLPREQVKTKISEVTKGKFLEKNHYELYATNLKHSSYCLAYSFKEKDKRKINLEYTKKFGLVKHPLLGDLQKGKNIKFKGKLIKAEKATTIKKGKKVTIILDTIPCKNCIDLAKDSDILICESTYLEKNSDKARKYKHLTAKQAATIAKQAKVKQLVLTHFSQRHKDLTEVLKEAKKVFKNTICAKDFLTLTL